MHAGDLIDTTEMYLRTIYELEEEGIVPMRARIAERLRQSGPTVSQTVARMERDGLVRVGGDRQLDLTDEGRRLAVQVMRRHRLAECLLIDVIGMPWEDVHLEACRWEHVMSEAVETRVWTLLGQPMTSPYGNPIPGVEALGFAAGADDGSRDGFSSLNEVAGQEWLTCTVRRIDEPIQSDVELMRRLIAVGAQPGGSVRVQRTAGGCLVSSDEVQVAIDVATAMHVHVEVPQTGRE